MFAEFNHDRNFVVNENADSFFSIFQSKASILEKKE